MSFTKTPPHSGTTGGIPSDPAYAGRGSIVLPRRDFKLENAAFHFKGAFATGNHIQDCHLALRRQSALWFFKRTPLRQGNVHFQAQNSQEPKHIRCKIRPSIILNVTLDLRAPAVRDRRDLHPVPQVGHFAVKPAS